jgi:hypothetical protein
VLAAEIEAAKQRELVAALDAGEKAVAESHAYLLIAPEPAPGDVELLKPWLTWCRDKSVRSVPAKVWCCAAYVLDRHNQGIPESQIFDELRAIERLHSKWRLPNPVETAICKAAIERITQTHPPRSWPAADRALFATLDPQIRHRIAEREKDRERELRSCQNRAAEAERKLKELIEQKPGEPKSAVTTDEKEKV